MGDRSWSDKTIDFVYGERLGRLMPPSRGFFMSRYRSTADPSRMNGGRSATEPVSQGSNT